MATLDAVSEIVNKIIENIKVSKNQLFLIIENLRTDYQKKVKTLTEIREQLKKLIDEVDQLEILDRKIRSHLSSVSKNFYGDYEKRIQDTYEKATQIRVQLSLRKQQEKNLRKERDELEIDLRQALKNIEAAEVMAQQVSVAMRYLEKDLVQALGGTNELLDFEAGVHILNAQEAERARIGREIHDGPAQHMANVLMMVDFCKMVIGKDLDAGLMELDALKENVKVSLKEVRRILFDLKPVALEELGLNQALEELIEHTIVETDLKVVKNLKNIKEEIAPVTQTAIYRIIQEIINNIRKHAKASKITIQLDFGTEAIVLIVSDDGIGFNVEETLAKATVGRQSYGLVGIHERANQLRGTVTIKSELNKGTNYYIKLPIK